MLFLARAIRRSAYFTNGENKRRGLRPTESRTTIYIYIYIYTFFFFFFFILFLCKSNTIKIQLLRCLLPSLHSRLLRHFLSLSFDLFLSLFLYFSIFLSHLIAVHFYELYEFVSFIFCFCVFFVFSHSNAL